MDVQANSQHQRGTSREGEVMEPFYGIRCNNTYQKAYLFTVCRQP